MYRCLIIDDEQRICTGLKGLIDWVRLGFSDCDLALSAQQALEMYEACRYDLVLSDVRMPGMDGLELFRRIRERDKCVRFIVISGFGEFEYARTAMRHGASGYLLKPVNENKLYELVSHIRQELDCERKETRRARETRRALLSDCLQSCLDSGVFASLEKLPVIAGLEQSDYPLLFTVAMVSDSRYAEACLSSADERKDAMAEGFAVHLGEKPLLCFLLKHADADSVNARLQGLYESVAARDTAAEVLAAGSASKDPPEFVCHAESVLQACLVARARPGSHEPVSFVKMAAFRSVEFARIADYIRRHCCEDISIKGVAAEFYINPVYFGRVFKNNTGMKFSDYVNVLRIGIASELLKNRNTKVADVCRMVGYRDIVYFYRKFKEIKGKLPSDYRPSDDI